MVDISFAPVRFHASSMELASFLDDQFVEMNIRTDKGWDVTVVCDKDSLMDMQRRIKKLVVSYPEHLVRTKYDDIEEFQDNAAGS
jgi:hypothetical protein